MEPRSARQSNPRTGSDLRPTGNGDTQRHSNDEIRGLGVRPGGSGQGVLGAQLQGKGQDPDVLDAGGCGERGGEPADGVDCGAVVTVEWLDPRPDPCNLKQGVRLATRGSPPEGRGPT